MWQLITHKEDSENVTRADVYGYFVDDILVGTYYKLGNTYRVIINEYQSDVGVYGVICRTVKRAKKFVEDNYLEIENEEKVD